MPEVWRCNKNQPIFCNELLYRLQKGHDVRQVLNDFAAINDIEALVRRSYSFGGTVFESTIRKQRSRFPDRNCIDINSECLQPTLPRSLNSETDVAPNIDEARANHALFDAANPTSGPTYLRINLLTVLSSFVVVTVKLSQFLCGRHWINIG